MSQRKQAMLSLMTAVVWVIFPLLFAAIGYATFILPATVGKLQAQGKSLSTGLQLMVDLSDFCKSFWFVVFPLLLILAVGTSRFLATLRSKNP